MTYIPSLVKACRAFLVAVSVSALTVPALAVGNSPADPVPSDRWGNPAQMRPWAIVGDSTIYDGHIVPNEHTPIWHGMDVAGGYLFTATGKGVMVHDLQADPTDPTRLGYVYAAKSSSPVPTWFQSDQKFYIYDIAVPGDNHNIAVSVGSANGVIVWDFRDKTRPDVYYQDYTHGAEHGHSGVWANTIGGRDYAFAANGAAGVSVYDLTTVVDRDYRRCDTAKSSCSDVYKGTIPTGSSAFAVDGAGNYLAVSMQSKGLEIWNVSNPSSPQRVLAAAPSVFSTYQGVALWKQGTSGYYVGVYDGMKRDGTYYTYVFDVSCIATGSCAGTNPLTSPVAKLSSNGYILGLVNDSTDGGRNYLYLGGSGPDTGSGGDQREFLYDVTVPGNPVELTPKNPKGKGYWGWYYEGNNTGNPADGAFESVGPRVAMVRNGYVYRAAFTLLDVHELLGAAPPVADFDWTPTPVYAGQQITFNDRSGGAPTNWLWQFSGAAPSATQSLVQNPKITFDPTSFPATATVTLSTSNEAGSGDPVAKQVSVLDPTPNMGSVSFAPSSPLVCQQLVFSANNVTGRPPLAYSWVVKDGSGGQVATGNGNPFSWQTGEGTAAGGYTAEVTVTNGTTPATGNVAFTLVDPPQLAINSGPSTDPFDFGTVQFRSQTAGAASWTWDFGDGNATCPTGFSKTQAGCTTTDPSKGKTPIYNYGATGTYTVTLTVANCKHGQQSAQVQVQVNQIDPLKITQFQARSQCQVVPLPGGCFTAGKAITFDQAVSGTPDSYEYDWNGDGTWDQTSTTPVTSHTYGNAGTYTPKMRIVRGSEPPVVVQNGCSSEQVLSSCPSQLIVSAALPASLSVTGASSGSTNQSLSFSASASNCSPLSSGWSWTAGGGGVVTPSGSTATVVWASAGSKTVSVTNSGCPNATGSKTVSISAPGGGGENPPPVGTTLKAIFSFSPTAPTAGQAVSFDASASAGSPTGYSWTFGDGGTAATKIASHTFAAPGSYSIQLTVSAPGNCPNSVGVVAGICTHTTTKVVNVAAGNSVAAKFDDGDSCQAGQVGGVVCTVETGREITFTDTSEGKVDRRTWDFGDGTTSDKKTVKHAWTAPGTYLVTLTVENGDDSDTVSKTYSVIGDPEPVVQPVVVPWIAQADADKALHQTSDLDVHNPGDEPIKVRMTFRKRGLPEPDPPQVERTIPAGATVHVPDAMKELFNRENISGFLFVEPVEGKSQPVVTSFNRTFTESGESYGQVVPGFPLGNLREAAQGSTVRHLVGLNDNGARQAYFGISNPSDTPVRYHLRFYDSLGRLVGGTTEPQGIARFGQKQYQVEDIRRDFGVENIEDYRIEIEVVEGNPDPFVYGANLRLVSRDPSFLRVGRTDLDEVFLVGVLNTPGLNDSFFQSDVVLGNTGGSDALCDLTYTPVGFQSEPTAAFTETVPAGQSVRLGNVVAEWDVGSSVGVLRVACDGAGGRFPVIQGEGYDVSRPLEVYGQFMPALSLDDAAEPGSPHSLVGLRQDAENRTTLWIYNPADEVARYDVRYFDRDGNEVGGESKVPLGRGKFRQINPSHHPAGIAGGFVVRVEVLKGKLLTAAQVVNAANDPAYIVGQ